MGDLLYSERL